MTRAGATDHPWLAAFLLVALVGVCYFPALQGGFVMDDDLYLSSCPLVKTPDGLYRFWFTTEPVDYWPMSNTTFWIEWRLWGTNPTGYHVINLTLHVVDSLLIWLVLSRLSTPGAWLAALLFAVHPVNVESVAWISQRKNVLSLLFFLVSILWYLKADRGVGRWYWLSLLAFTLAMLSKGSVAILPVLLLGLAWWQRDEITGWDLVRTAPFFVVAVLLTAVNLWFQTHGSGHSVRDASFLERLLGAGAVVWFYLYKALVPLNLAFFYPQWDIHVNELRWWLPLAPTLTVTIALIWRRSSRTGRPLLFAWLFFCVALVPVMGFTDVGFMKYSLVADRYLHIALIAVVAVVAAALIQWRAHPASRMTATFVAALLIGVLSYACWRHCEIYSDAESLYRDAIAKNPESWISHAALGGVLARQGDRGEALDHLRRALQLNPDHALTHLDVASVLLETPRDAQSYSRALQEAREHLDAALRLSPKNVDVLSRFIDLSVQENQPEEAKEYFDQASQIDRGQAAYGMGSALLNMGKLQEAQTYLEEAVRLRPEIVEAHQALGNLLALQGKLDLAVVNFREATWLRPDYFQAWHNLGATLVNLGKPDEAIPCIERALQIRPDDPDAKKNLQKAREQLTPSR